MQKEKKVVDPFDINEVVNPSNKPEPSISQKRFYYYFHLPTRRMIVRFGNETIIVDEVETIGINAWTAKHKVGRLQRMVAGNATRMYLDGDKAILS